MSEMIEESAIELERKFLISKEVALLLIKEAEALDTPVAKKRIEQNYLFNENARVFYDIDNNMWNVTLKTGKKSETFKFEEINHPEIAKDILSQYSGQDLLNTKCATRIRMLDGEPIFTFKRPLDFGKGDHEFEQNIKNVVKDSELFLSFINNDTYKVNKNRFIVLREELKYEIDYFDDIDLSKQNKDLDISILGSDELCLLEVEFNTQELHDNFELEVTNVEVTEVKGFGNKMMAKSLAKQAKKSKNKKRP